MHLAGVGVGETAELQVDQHEAAQAAVIEDEVHAVLLVADAPAPPSGEASDLRDAVA